MSSSTPIACDLSAIAGFWHNPHPDNIKLGLDEFDREEDQTVGGMLKTPIAKQKRDV